MVYRQTMLAVALLALTACGPDRSMQLKQVHVAYDRGDYAGAYQSAQEVVEHGAGKQADEAAYLAGMAALRLHNLPAAEANLRQATGSGDAGIAAYAKAQLGLVYAEEKRYDLAVTTLEDAGRQLEGQNRANAYFHAALSQQKLGRWERARENLARARTYSDDPKFKVSCTELMSVVGYTVQTGAFGSAANAQREAKELAGRASQLGLAAPRVAVTADPGGKAQYLVQIGQFPHYAAADQARERLRVAGAIVAPLRGK